MKMERPGNGIDSNLCQIGRLPELPDWENQVRKPRLHFPCSGISRQSNSDNIQIRRFPNGQQICIWAKINRQMPPLRLIFYSVIFFVLSALDSELLYGNKKQKKTSFKENQAMLLERRMAGDSLYNEVHY